MNHQAKCFWLTLLDRKRRRNRNTLHSNSGLSYSIVLDLIHISILHTFISVIVFYDILWKTLGCWLCHFQTCAEQTWTTGDLCKERVIQKAQTHPLTFNWHRWPVCILSWLALWCTVWQMTKVQEVWGETSSFVFMATNITSTLWVYGCLGQ
jgi:hypothetical protein